MGDWLSQRRFFFPDTNGLARHVKVKIKTSTLEQPITKLRLLESVGH